MRLQKFYKVAVLIAIAFMAASLALPNSGGNAHTPVPPTTSASPAIEQVELREGKLVFSELPQEGCGATNLITFELRACINLNQDKVVYYSILTGEKAVEDLGILIFIWLETSQGERVFPRFCEVSTHTLNIKRRRPVWPLSNVPVSRPTLSRGQRWYSPRTHLQGYQKASLQPKGSYLKAAL